jgi:hypothetical protein
MYLPNMMRIIELPRKMDKIPPRAVQRPPELESPLIIDLAR